MAKQIISQGSPFSLRSWTDCQWTKQAALTKQGIPQSLKETRVGPTAVAGY